LFDLDGTLIDSREDLIRAEIEAFRIAGFPPPSREEIVPVLGTPLEEVPGALGRDFTPEEMERLFKAFRAWYPEHWMDHTTLFPGVEETLARLGKRYDLAIVTTKRQVQADRITEAFGITNLFRHIQGWREGLRHKPNPDLPLASLYALGVEPARAVMIGDTFRDIEAGKKAGCATVAVTYGEGREEDLRALNPDAMVGGFEEIPGALERIRSADGGARLSD
jgi:HAD superfamily hydrolase (TIGR01509 family)